MNAALALVGKVVLAQFLVFGDGPNWLILNERGEVHRAFTGFPAGIPTQVREVAVSPDGTRLAVTAFSPVDQNVMLYLWQLEGGSVSRIGDAVGFHAAPSFSRDGKRIVFAHHPKKGGPPGAHEEGSYAQLYEQNLETLELKALTASSGCHMGSVDGRGRLYFAHSNCLGGRRLEVLEAGVERPLTDFREHHGEPSLSADGATLVFTREREDDIELQTLSLKTPRAKPTRLWMGPRRGTRFSPQFLRDGTVMFQNGETVFALIRGVPSPRWDFRGGRK